MHNMQKKFSETVCTLASAIANDKLDSAWKFNNYIVNDNVFML